jgi:glycogen debranching enzyme
MWLRAFSRIAFIFVAATSLAQTSAFNSLAAIPFDSDGPVIRAHSETEKPFTVAGERGVVLGQQNGTFEAWVLPVKLLSHLSIEADIEGYTVPIDVNQQAAEIEVRPDRTVITYSHIGFTVRQIMFSPNNAATGTGPIVLFEFDCLHPTEFIFRFSPELRWMWPERNEGVPNVEWVSPDPRTPSVAGGFYVLHADYPDLAGAITIPGAKPGILAPYQERPQVHPVELHLHIDPARDRGRLFPLLMAAGMNKASATSAALGATLAKLNATIPDTYKTHADSYTKLLSTATLIKTPDQRLDEAFQWAVISIEQLKTKALPDDETALVAGYYASADSARPGFGWFFGRDALYTLFAVNGYGDFSLTKSELEFLIKRQREDGKIMHEYSQTAAFIDWRQFPYMYAAADATPLFLLAVADYVRSSGDVAFLNTHRDAIEKAWSFETGHADANGIYSNAQGTGWVESWPGGMPHQEVYLAALDQQASAAMGLIENLLNDRAKSVAARRRAEDIAGTINQQFYDANKGCYAFSRNTDGSLDRTTTVYPALAWWTNPSVEFTKVFDAPDAHANSSIFTHPNDCLKQFAGHALNTDWGLRDVSNDEKIYDGMSYHQGSVWPLFTGWAALAEYRGNQPLAGYQLLMENANLTRAQDLGAVTELLSGDFFVPCGRSTSHQLWSSAMVITPTLRGLFGLDIDAQTKTITVNPHLPASWDSAEILNLQLGGGPSALYFTRKSDHLEVSLGYASTENWHLKSDLPGASFGALDAEKPSQKTKNPVERGLRIPVPALEIDPLLSNLHNVTDAVGASLPDRAPLPGSRTSRFRIVHSEYADHKLTLVAEGLAGTEGSVSLVRHGRFTPKIDTGEASATAPTDAKISMREASEDPAVPVLLVFDFPQGEGWKTVTVTLTW